MTTRVLLIDNYDSFTYNLVQAFLVLGADVLVHRNDAISVADAVAMDPTHVVISPGPGHPRDAGVSLGVLEKFTGVKPILGVCLGHQAIGLVMGATVDRAPKPMHGKASPVFHDGKTIYQDLPNPFEVGRYHSLCVIEGTLPAELAVSSYTEDGVIMGVRHRELLVEGVQFHPESVLTPDGPRLLANFLRQGA
jgi:para-aminobenzoate synthetase component 2